jgi:hypothetical protein
MVLFVLPSYQPSSKLEIELNMSVPAKKLNQDRIETPSLDALSPDDYRQQGLKVLARIIARIHMQRATKNLEGSDGPSKGKPSS